MKPWVEKFLERFQTNRIDLVVRSSRRPRRRRPSCESLEGRALLTGLNVDYTLMGGQWNNSQPITFSIAPDGQVWDRGTNNVNAVLNAQFGGTSWQKDVAVALQTWAVSANLNFAAVSDGAYGFNVQGDSQGDPRFGDIRVAGYAFANNPIAQTYGPPPNGWTAGGDVKINTADTFGPNGVYDLQSVLIHEVGHSLGLGESPQPDAIMYAYYSGARESLSSYDVEGIQSIYGPRVADSFQSRGQGVSASSAIDLTSSFNSGGLAVVNGLSLASIGASEYFSVTAPNRQGATLQINAVANGHSLLSPKVSVIDAATGATLAVDAHPDQYGNTSTVFVPGTQAGHRYLVVVTGATQDVFSVGNYTLQAGFAGGANLTPPVDLVTQVPVTTNPAPVSLPVTVVPMVLTPVSAPAPTSSLPIASSVSDLYSANTSFANAANLGSIAGQSLIHNVSLSSGTDVRVFTFQPAQSGLIFVASANTTILVGDSMSRPVASGRGLVGFVAPQAGAHYYVVLVSPNHTAVADASFAIQVVPMATTTPTVSTPLATTVKIGQPTPTGSVVATANRKQKRRRYA